MAKGIDCATALTVNTAAAFAADGNAFVARYLVPVNSWKALTLAEAEIITAAGMHIVSVFETSAGRPLTGKDGGKNDGSTALQLAKDIGQPEGSTIYAAVDFDATPGQMPLILAYLKAFDEATPGYATGVYGSAYVVEAVQAAGVCSHYWQTYAWSRGKVVDGIHIYQFRNDIEVNGIGVDLNESYGAEGWWSLAAIEEEKEAEDGMEKQQMVEYEADWKWDQLAKSLDGLYHAGLLENYNWAEQASNRDITISDALLIMATMLARQNGVKIGD
ncbi:DUF1906 domain-containing protein [Paenibacillus agricola]|uniref:DUF1906 domain-containing protein n=1 Tax=Paenibacillus agricola TaxID=2716264 RepID=A0ABX0JI77_9BACL|nr:DUF1906 domain-containing protein [Paenibacillus agricola]NHN33581.1 DUF1906 domain-containing protein [Paenibacillus agricola]